MKKLIAYYSRAGENYFSGAHRTIAVGNTEKAARLLAELTGAELFHIEQKVPYSDNYDTCVAEARRDLRANARPELTALPESLDDYDEIYLGYPNYCGTMPMAVYTFLEHYDWQGKTIHPFCTNEGSGLSNTEQDIRRAARHAFHRADLPTRYTPCLDTLYQRRALSILLRPHFIQTTFGGTGISTCCPSPTAFALGLGPDLP